MKKFYATLTVIGLFSLFYFYFVYFQSVDAITVNIRPAE